MRNPLLSPWRVIILAAFAGILALSGAPLAAKEKQPKESRMKDIADTVASKRILTKFDILLRVSGQDAFLSSRGPFTLFAPTDSAFSRISSDTFAALQRPENRDLLQRVILFHIVNAQRLTAHDLGPLKTLLSCEGSPLPLRINHTGYQIVSKAKILDADIRCLNGLVHEIDAVLLPPGVSLSALAATPAPAPPVNDMANPVAPTNSAPITDALAPDTNSDVSTQAAPGTNSLAPVANVTTNAPVALPLSP